MKFPLHELRLDAISKGASHGQARTPETGRAAAAAIVAFRAAKYLDSCGTVITQAETDYICEVIASRVGRA